MHFQDIDDALIAHEDKIAEARLRIALNVTANGAVRGAEHILTIGSGPEADVAFQAEADEFVARCREFFGRLQRWLRGSDAGENTLTIPRRVQMISRALANVDHGVSKPGELAALWTRMRIEALS